jgi:hypothetical protein
MRVVCDQCAASYKVPNARLTRPINKATCKSCGSRLLIPKPQPGADDDERVVVPAVPATGMSEPVNLVPGEEDDDDAHADLSLARRARATTIERQGLNSLCLGHGSTTRS